jgi:hypothetical protein
MTNLLDFTKALFGSDKMWSEVSDLDKEAHYFIINRMFSKKYPEWSLYLSSSNISKPSAMDTWHSMVKGRGYEAWFWSKSGEKSKKNGQEIDRELALRMELSLSEIEVFSRIHPQEYEKKIKEIKKEKNDTNEK